MNVAALHDAIAAVCPIIAVSIGNEADRSTWQIEYDPSATDAQKAAAQQVLASWTSLDVPQQVPMWAAQAALKQAGKYDAINQFIVGDATASPPVPSLENTNPPVFFAWTMGNFASRQSTLMAALASQFGMTDAGIDAVFVAADQIAQAAG